MNEKDIRKLSKTELIELLLFQSKQIDELKNKLSIIEAEHVKKSDLITRDDIHGIVSRCLNDKTAELRQETVEIKNSIPGKNDIKEIIREEIKKENIPENISNLIPGLTNYIDKKTAEQTDKIISEIDKKYTELLLELSREGGKKRNFFGR